ncbi:acyltransferase family protein [Mesorhizobium sp. INR15]|uniref:acyltransferase family protein n=1 Tax=Mesorhizobium sp. INR15 TaxID=2654248 RepID=UPI0018964A6F|nr:acyltransferase family protein [Mesorhizobium sp. INR15]
MPTLGGANTLPKQVYRRDIDGLRAIAVLAVLFYHVGISAVPGGFVGVDVFFVISGYLIGGRIFHCLATGQFSFIDFYERRARRILPAYFAVSTLTAIAAYAFFMPEELVRFSKSLIASSLLSGNFGTRTDYFRPAAETLPLLHYWSLGVEEHFYLLFPVIALFTWRFGPRALASILAIILVSSLIASQWMLSISPAITFYWLPFRAWELFIGSMLALPFFKPPKSLLIGSIASTAGVLVVLATLILYSSSMPFPGIAALPPCIGAALIIWGGQRQNFASRFLGLEPMNYIGRSSYSLYLIHWPVIVFARLLYPDASISVFSAVTIAGSFALAGLSYQFIEIPTRNREGFWQPRRIFEMSTFGVVASLALAGFTFASGGFLNRLPSDVQDLLTYRSRYENRTDAGYRNGQCFVGYGDTYATIDQATCLPVEGSVALLWGDSYAAHYTIGLRPILEHKGFVFAQLNDAGCPPIVGRNFPQQPNCKAFNDAAFEWIKKNRPKLVIMSARWFYMSSSWFYDEQAIQSLKRQISEFPAETAVVILGQSPTYEEEVPVILARRRLRGDRSTISEGEIRSRIFGADRMMKAEMADTPALYVSVLDAVCPNQKCPMYADGTPIHLDQGHLTDVGSKLFAERISAEIASSKKLIAK